MTHVTGTQATTDVIWGSDAESAASDGIFSPTEEKIDDIPVIVFLIPGIRSNKLWAQDFRVESNSWMKKRIEARIVAGPSRLTSVHLIFRIGLRNIREDFKNQICKIAARYPESEIHFVCHSMGASLFSEILEDLIENKCICGGKESRIKNIIFLGSVCHPRSSEMLFESCDQLINDVGTRDKWPLIANTINCFKYGITGTFGFNKCYVVDRYYDNDHTSCTSKPHLFEKIMPLIEEGILLEPKVVKPHFDHNVFTYVQRAVWCLLIGAMAMLIWVLL